MFTLTYQVSAIGNVIARNVPPYRHENMMRIPDFGELAKLPVPKHVLQALQRSTWEQVASDMLRADLVSKAGKPLGAIFAQWQA